MVVNCTAQNVSRENLASNETSKMDIQIKDSNLTFGGVPVKTIPSYAQSRVI